MGTHQKKFSVEKEREFIKQERESPATERGLFSRNLCSRIHKKMQQKGNSPENFLVEFKNRRNSSKQSLQ